MACESWIAKLDTYLDGELEEGEMRSLDAHIHSCTLCAAEALKRVQMKRAVKIAGRHFTANPDFKRRVQSSIGMKTGRRNWRSWGLLAAFASILVVAGALIYSGVTQSGNKQVYSEIADLHVSMLASPTPVDVVSSDRHTVKPWFQGKIPFSFDLPELSNLSNNEISLVGGRMTYLEQAPGAHLVYKLRKHQVSVFIFREDSLRQKLGPRAFAIKSESFNVETWSRDGLRYFVIGDASAADLDRVASLFKSGALQSWVTKSVCREPHTSLCTSRNTPRGAEIA